MDPQELVSNLAQDMLMAFYQPEASGPDDLKFNQAIEAAYQKLTGYPFFYREHAPSYLRGHPGQGKTTCVKHAAKTVAGLLGLNFVLNPGEEYQPSANDLLFSSKEFSGEVSNVAIKGLPTVEKTTGPNGTEIAHMKQVPPMSIAALSSARAAVLLLDDFANAAPNVQNIGLSLMEERRFQGTNLANTFVIATGNLGALDNTHVSSTSSALATRCQNILVEDTLELFAKRTMERYADSISDAGLLGFMNKHQELFHKPAGGKKGEPYPVSRTWDKALPYLRELKFRHQHDVATAGGMNLDKSLFDLKGLQARMGAIVGTEAALAMKSYYVMLMTSAEPIAKKFIEGAPLSDAEMKLIERHSKNVDPDADTFWSGFVDSLASHTASAITTAFREDESSYMQTAKPALTGFVSALYDQGLATTERMSRISHAFATLGSRLCAMVKDKAVAYYTPQDHLPQMSKELCEWIVDEAVTTKGARLQMDGKMLIHSTCIDVISNFGRFKQNDLLDAKDLQEQLKAINDEMAEAVEERLHQAAATDPSPRQSPSAMF